MTAFLKKHLFVAALLVVALGASPLAVAHHLWLYASRYNTPRLATARQWGQWKPDSVVLFGYGDYYPLHDLLERERVASFTRYSANGDQQPLALGDGPFLASPLTVFVPGAHLIAAELHPRFVSRVGAETQHHYLFVPRDEVMEGLPVIRSYVYHNYAKALFQVGPREDRSEDAALLARPLGHALEIVLLSNPRALADAPPAPSSASVPSDKAGGAGGKRDACAGVEFAVLFKGQPLADATVRANHLGLPASTEGASVLVELDEAGRGILSAPRAGVWQLHLMHRLPAPPELASKAAALTYSASFTFEVPSRPVAPHR